MAYTQSNATLPAKPPGKIITDNKYNRRNSLIITIDSRTITTSWLRLIIVLENHHFKYNI